MINEQGLYDEISQFAEQSLDRSWILTPERDKARILEEAANIAGSQYVQVRASGAAYKDAELKIEKLDKTSDGLHYTDTIKINSKRISDKHQSFLTAVHEGVHQGQHQLYAHAREVCPEPIKAALEVNSSTVFKIHNYGRTYISPSVSGMQSMNPELRQALYRTCMLEREAYKTEMEVANHLNLDTTKIKSQMEHALTIIRDTYGCRQMSDEEIFQLVDSAQVNVAQGLTPKTAIEASMTYDYAALVFEQSPLSRIGVVRTIRSVEEKSLCLEQHGFNYAHTISDSDAIGYTPQMIKDLPQVVRDQNPDLMTIGMCKYGSEVASCVNRESYDRWYFSEENQFKPKFLDDVSKVLGPEYSAQNRNTVINQQQNTPEILMDSTGFEMNTFEIDRFLDKLMHDSELDGEEVVEVSDIFSGQDMDIDVNGLLENFEGEIDVAGLFDASEIDITEMLQFDGPDISGIDQSIDDAPSACQEMVERVLER